MKNSTGNKWERRDKKRHQKKHGMRVHGKNMLQIENSLEIRNQRRQKEAQREDIW